MGCLPTGPVTCGFPAKLVDAHGEGWHIVLCQRPDEVGPIQSRSVRGLLLRHCARATPIHGSNHSKLLRRFVRRQAQHCENILRKLNGQRCHGIKLSRSRVRCAIGGPEVSFVEAAKGTMTSKFAKALLLIGSGPIWGSGASSVPSSTGVSTRSAGEQT